MAFALLIIGITLIVAAVRNTQDTLIKLLKADFSGKANFIYWIVALLVVGSIGYVEKLKPLSDGLLLIILLVLVLARSGPNAPRGGFFQQFVDALNSSTSAATPTGTQTSGVTLGGGPSVGRTVGINLPSISIGV